MPTTLALLGLLKSALRTRRRLVAENLALRHQLAVLKRSVKRPRLEDSDRIFWILLRRTVREWKGWLYVVKPETVVVRYGRMRQIGEYTYKGDVRPGCGSKMVVRTHRGTELGELLTSTCPNAGCGKSVTRQEMLEYIENSGGRDYPFRDDGRAVRLATPQDMKTQQDLDATIPDLVRSTRQIVKELGLEMKIVDADAGPARSPSSLLRIYTFGPAGASFVRRSKPISPC